ncbi:uncharacterized protein LOC125759250 [Rhipicephalus sanguineus]|uniref:uncharacterized protein LOC125759250 n=1 Tax=Rhipicephalus sanguineus TaxID=34632 RepID=UPI0020C38DAC|nr:uncharacterized protein LOC125759250 [Rhipicephalus sanguineus]
MPTCGFWMSVHVSWGHVMTHGYGGGALSVSTWKQNCGLLGDSSYPLEPCLLTPLPGRPAPGTPENYYNKAHTAMRTVVERCSGVLKSRFQSLQRYRTLLYNPDRAATIIAACAALHDIALAAHEPVLEGHDDDTDDAELLPAAADLPPPPQREPAAAQPRSEPVSRTTGPACRAPAQSTPPPATTSAALCGGFRCNEGPGEGTNALQFVDHVTEKLNLAQLSNDAWPCRLVFAASNSSALACRLPTSRSCGMSWKPRNVLPLSSINFLLPTLRWKLMFVKSFSVCNNFLSVENPLTQRHP